MTKLKFSCGIIARIYMEVGYIFKKDCPDCGEIKVAARRVQVNAPDNAALKLGMSATFLVRCPNCEDMFGGDLEHDEVDALASNWANIYTFGVPTTPDKEPNYQPRISQNEIRKFGYWLNRVSPTSVFAAILDPRDFE